MNIAADELAAPVRPVSASHQEGIGVDMQKLSRAPNADTMKLCQRSVQGRSCNNQTSLLQ